MKWLHLWLHSKKTSRQPPFLQCFLMYLLFKSHLPHEKSPGRRTWVFSCRRGLEPGFKVSSARRPRRSVRWEKGPLDLFLIPPHPIFRILWKGTWNRVQGLPGQKASPVGSAGNSRRVNIPAEPENTDPDLYGRRQRSFSGRYHTETRFLIYLLYQGSGRRDFVS